MPSRWISLCHDVWNRLTGYSLQTPDIVFVKFDSSIVAASARSEGRNVIVDDMTAAVWPHRLHEAKAKEVKQAHDQFRLAALNKPQWSRTKWQAPRDGATRNHRRGIGPSRKMDFRSSQTRRRPMAKLLAERFDNTCYLLRKHVAWLAFPTEVFSCLRSLAGSTVRALRAGVHRSALTRPLCSSRKYPERERGLTSNSLSQELFAIEKMAAQRHEHREDHRGVFFERKTRQ